MVRKESKSKDASPKREMGAGKGSGLFYVLRLFVTGMTPRSIVAIENVRKLCEEHLKGHHQLEVIDIYQHPRSASENQIIAAPTLVKKLPLPLRKFVGDMTNKEKILVGLDLEITKGPVQK